MPKLRSSVIEYLTCPEGTTSSQLGYSLFGQRIRSIYGFNTKSAIVRKAIRFRQTKQHLINLYDDNNAAGEDLLRTRRISNARNDI